jgi:CelD/BcsL family acetyltransferase involved in cellulose biosynthesis
MTGEAAFTSADAPVRVEPVPSLDTLRDEWTALAQERGNIFSSWEWASIWRRHYGGERPLLLTACRTDDGRLAALLPLYLWKARPVRVGRFLGHGPADQLGPICDAEDRKYAAAALARVCGDADLDLLIAEHLPRREGWRSALGATPLFREASPTLSLDRDWEAYLASRSANLRQQVRRRERRLARSHSVRFRLADDATRLQDDLTTLFALHAARWGEKGSAFLPFESFHRDFAPVALERGWLRLWFLELDGRVAAAWYGFRYGRVESYYQAGRDPDRSDESVGFVLLAHSIREAAADGMREYRFLRGAELYKSRFADADHGLETVGLSRGVAGRIAGVAAAARLHVPVVRATLGRLVAPITR